MPTFGRVSHISFSVRDAEPAPGGDLRCLSSPNSTGSSAMDGARFAHASAVSRGHTYFMWGCYVGRAGLERATNRL